MKSALALTFHRIYQKPTLTDSLSDLLVDRYSVTVDRFKQTVNMIPTEKCCTVSEYVNKEKRDWLILTFDDGYISDFETVFPILKDSGIKATFFISAENLGLSGYSNALQLREMDKEGMEIGSHGLTHRYLITMSEKEAIQEIRSSKDKLEQEIGTHVISFAPVGGHYRKWMEDVAYEAGYRVFATMIPGRTNSGGDLILLRRNHIQFHHDIDYLFRLINGDYKLLIKNRLRYGLLQVTKTVLGMEHYDLAKEFLLRNFSSFTKTCL